MTSERFFVGGRIQLDRQEATTNNDVLAAWTKAVGERYRGSTVRAYTEAAQRFFEFLDREHLSLSDLTPQTLCDYLCAVAAKCRNLLVLNSYHVCRQKLFQPATALPLSCGLSCSGYGEVKVESYLTVEKALARLFEFITEGTTVPMRNFFPEVRARIHASFKKRRLREREDSRYPRRALTNEEIADLFRACGHPRDRLVIAFMLKTGARHQETLRLPDGPDLREAWERERIITVTSGEGVKRLGNPYLVIDDQLWGAFERYFAWKDAILHDAPENDSRRQQLFLGKDGSRPMDVDSMRRLWREAGARAAIVVSPVRDAPLTAHSARYTFCRLLEEGGFSPFWIGRLRGDVQAPDAALKSAWTYAKRSPAELREEYLARFPSLPI